MSGYAHVMLGVPTAVLQEVKDLKDDATKAGDAVREVLELLDPEKRAVVLYGGTTYHVYLITVDDDLDEGAIKRLKQHWPTIKILLAFDTRTGLQVGQSRDEQGNVTGTPRYTLTTAQRTALLSAFDPTYVVGGKLTPPNRMQGQTDWEY